MSGRDLSPALISLQEAMGYVFSNPSFLKQALVHASCSDARSGGSNQRLEFLGDRVLGHVVALMLYTTLPDAAEGLLAKTEAYLVSAPVLARIALVWGVGPALLMSSSEEKAGGRTNHNILADAAEALIAAVALDGGFEAAQKVVQAAMAPVLQEETPAATQDPKSYVQEWAQGRRKPLPVYELVAQTGPDHAPEFTVRLEVEGCDPVLGVGSSKRLAEQAAAHAFIQQSAGDAACPKI